MQPRAWTHPAAIALVLLAGAAGLIALPGLRNRALPFDCALPPGELRCDRPCAFRCTAPASWGETPYVVLDGQGDGAAALRWSGELALLPGEGADAGARWEGPVVEAQLLLAGTWTLRALTLHSRLGPLQRLRLVARELLAPAPYVASSNNTIAPRWVLSGSLAAWAGGASLLLLLPLFVPALRRVVPPGRLALGVALAGFALVAGGTLASLAAHGARAVEHSALQDTLRAEEAARFGEPFAQLAEALRARVPPGALVLFPRDREHAAESEAHWMDFHFWPQYRTVPAEGSAPRYVFWYRPLLLRRERDAVLGEDGKVLLRAKTLFALDDQRALLQVVP